VRKVCVILKGQLKFAPLSYSDCNTINIYYTSLEVMRRRTAIDDDDVEGSINSRLIIFNGRNWNRVLFK
jgi:hypothetical protein